MALTLEDILSKVKIQRTVMERKYINAPEDVVLQAIAQIGRQIDPRFVIDVNNEEVYRCIALWYMNDSRLKAIDPSTGERINGRLDKGLYIAGPAGTGKTTAMRILRYLYRTNPFLGAEQEWPAQRKAIAWTEMRSDEISDVFAETGSLIKAKESTLLCIQDLGSESSETLYMGNRVNVVKSVIEHRGDMDGMVTMVTSNLPLGKGPVTERYGVRAESRMVEMMNYLVLKGPDRRRNI